MNEDKNLFQELTEEEEKSLQESFISNIFSPKNKRPKNITSFTFKVWQEKIREHFSTFKGFSNSPIFSVIKVKIKQISENEASLFLLLNYKTEDNLDYFELASIDILNPKIGVQYDPYSGNITVIQNLSLDKAPEYIIF